MIKILVTGAAGFIGFHLTKRLLSLGYEVVGLDNLNDYYDVNLKMDRLKNLGILNVQEGKLISSNIYQTSFQFLKLGIDKREDLFELFANNEFDCVCNLAAQAGVRYSIENPFSYVDSNLVGFINIIEACRCFNVPKLIYASSSSVYGLNKKVPYSINDNVDNPISLYAATKKSNELIAHAYSHLFGIKTFGLRFFTVYGPWGRPDMAMHLFTDAILKDKPINVYNEGNLSRDFTYIDDIVEGIVTIILSEKINNSSNYEIHNIGNSKSVNLMDFICEIENVTKKKAILNYLPMQPGDVENTWADTGTLENKFGYKPSTDIRVGVKEFIDWFKEYYRM
jgi:UDP-glucuronate 4-epimerase